MTSVSQVHRILSKGTWAVSIDLKDAYWYVPLKESFKKYLSFAIEGRKYQFRVLPFSLNIAPMVFTRLMKSILKELRLKE